MFSKFEDDLIQGFVNEPFCMHIHNWAISTSKFNSYPALTREFKILQSDTLNDVEFVCAFEGVNYPFFAVLYHPEYQILPAQRVMKFNNCPETLRIYKHLSQFMFEQASKNPNCLPDNICPRRDIPNLQNVLDKDLAELTLHQMPNGH